MNTARVLLPSVLLLYFLWRSLRQRVFLLGLPFLMDMYYSVFFEGLTPFWVPGQWAPADHMMFWLVVTWIVYFDLLLPGRRRSVRERRLFGPRLSAPEEIVLVGLRGLHARSRSRTTAVQYMDLGSALSEAQGAPLRVRRLLPAAGHLLSRRSKGDGGLPRRDRRRQHDRGRPLRAASGAAHCYIYAGVAGVSVRSSFNGEVLTRSFYFMPQYLPLAIAFCAAKRKWSLLWLGVLARDAGRHMGVLHAGAGPRRDR